MTAQDVVRHPLVQKIVNAYDEYESRLKRTEAGRSTRHRFSDQERQK
jgi:phosphate starvation-inducible PhoH-like protein